MSDITPTLAGPRRGRPPGLRNRAKTKASALSYEQLQRLYNRIEHMMTDEQRNYYQAAFSGKKEIDPIKEGELFLRLMSLYVTEAITWGLEAQSVTQDLAQLIAQYRMGIKDLEEMKRKREEADDKFNKKGRLVDPISQSARSRFENLVGKYTTTG